MAHSTVLNAFDYGLTFASAQILFDAAGGVPTLMMWVPPDGANPGNYQPASTQASGPGYGGVASITQVGGSGNDTYVLNLQTDFPFLRCVGFIPTFLSGGATVAQTITGTGIGNSPTDLLGYSNGLTGGTSIAFRTSSVIDGSSTPVILSLVLILSSASIPA